MYDVISTLRDPCHRRHQRRRRRKERPRRRPPVWREGLRLSLGWLIPPVPNSSDATVVPAILQEYGVVTPPSLGPGGRGVPPAVWAGRERALWPTPTAVRQQLKKIQKLKPLGLQFTSTDYLSIVSTPLRIRWTIPLSRLLSIFLWWFFVHSKTSYVVNEQVSVA
jgi:hypothetical protein